MYVWLYGCRPTPVNVDLACGLGCTLALSVTHSTVAKRRHNVFVNYITSDNILYCICQNSAAYELNMLH